MENVPDVHGQKNAGNFNKWCDKLETLGYHNYWKDLNAKDFQIPQNRERCFMVSLLGDYFYAFPNGEPLQLRLKDMLEKNVDEKFYISQEQADKLRNSTFVHKRCVVLALRVQCYRCYSEH